jgi:hypothetical protein
MYRSWIPTPPILYLRFAAYLTIGLAQDSRPSGSLVLTRKALSSSTPCRLSGKVVARSGLRMMPTFPPPPLSFRTVSFPAVRLEGWPFRQRLSPCHSGQAITGHTLLSMKVCICPSYTPWLHLTSGAVSGRWARWCTAIRGAVSSTPEVLAPVWVILSQSINA